MKLIQTLILSALCMGSTLEAGFLDEVLQTFSKTDEQEPTIGVLIAHDVPGVVLEVKGKYKIFDPHTRDYISTRFIGKRKFVQAIPDGIKWGEEFPTVHQIQIVPDDAKTTTIVDGIEYAGVITVYDIGGTISVVNEIPLNEYVLAILNPFYSSDLPEELAAAFAIAERTNALYQFKNAPSRYFTVNKELLNFKEIPSKKGFEPAVRETRNMVMAKENAPFPIQLFANKQNSKPMLGQLTLERGIEMAKEGHHAAQILKAAFPGSSVVLMSSLHKGGLLFLNLNYKVKKRDH